MQEHWRSEGLEPYVVDSLSLAITFAVQVRRDISKNRALNETAGACVEMWRKIVFRSNELTYGTRAKTELDWRLTENTLRINLSRLKLPKLREECSIAMDIATDAISLMGKGQLVAVMVASKLAKLKSDECALLEQWQSRVTKLFGQGLLSVPYVRAHTQN